MREFVAHIYTTIGLLLLFAGIIFCTLGGNPYRGRRASNWVIRQLLREVPGGEQYEVEHSKKKRLGARWPLWFGESAGGEPLSWVIVEVNYNHDVDLLIANIEPKMSPQRAQAWVWGTWPRPPNAIMVKKRQQMVNSIANNLDRCLMPEVQVRFNSPRAIFEEIKWCWCYWRAEQEQLQEAFRKDLIAEAVAHFRNKSG